MVADAAFTETFLVFSTTSEKRKYTFALHYSHLTAVQHKPLNMTHCFDMLETRAGREAYEMWPYIVIRVNNA